jgi:hypothetical protein
LQRLRRVDGCRKTYLKKKNTMSWLSLTPQAEFTLAIVYGVFVAKTAKEQMRHIPFFVYPFSSSTSSDWIQTP